MMKKKAALVFGGNGFVGSHLVRKLINSGDYSRVVSADISDGPRFKTPGVEIVHCDVREPIPDHLAGDGITEIYNLAAVHTTPGHEDWEYFTTNIAGAQNVTDYARRVGVNMIFFTSSISVYGSTEQPKTEESEPNPDSAYGQSKLLAEKVHQTWQQERPTERRLIVARPAVIFGFQEQGNFTRLAKLLRRGAFVYPGRKDTIKACGYVSDLLSTFEYFSTRSDSHIIYNFAFTERYSTEDICRAFNLVAGVPMPSRVIPIRLIMLGGLAFEILSRLGLKTSVNRQRLTKLYRSTNIVPQYLDRSGFQRSFDLKTALLDWKQQSSVGEFE
jgi:GlcNAc-P-P-Und epimerase